MDWRRPAAGRAWRPWAVIVLGLLALLGLPSMAAAHTEFESSEPSDGEIVDGPLDAVVVVFTNPAVESGDGFQLLTPDGEVRAPSQVSSGDGRTFEVAFDPPLEAGSYGFRWEVQAGDAHPIDGAFRFDVEQPAPTTTAAGSAPVATTASPGGSDQDGATDETGAADEGVGGAATGDSAAEDAGGEAQTLDEFLAGDGAPEPFAGRVGRTLSIGGSVFALGVLAALWWVVRGSPAELAGLLRWTQLAGVALLAGGVIELAALDELVGGPLGDVLTSKAGIATLLDVVGGVLIIVGFAPGRGAVREAAGEAGMRWVPSGAAVLGLIGVGASLVAYWFDGHTVSRGPWALHAAVNLVHAASAGVWAGGVFALTLVVVGRRRRGGPGGFLGLVVRFSTVAAVSLTALALAGLVLAWLVLDGPGELFSSTWGRILLAKVTAVTVAASLGAYNHFKLRPALQAHPDDDVLAGHLRSSLLIESAILAVVIVLTAVLVAAAI